MSSIRCLATGVLALTLAVTSLAPPLGAQEQLFKDIHGDPLPPGAIGRLGKMAFRVAAPVSAARYLDGGRKLLVKTHDATYRTHGTFQMFNAQSGKELNQIALEDTAEQLALRAEELIFSFPEWCLSPSGQWLVRWTPTPPRAPPNSNGRKWRREKSWPRSKPPSASFTARSFHPTASISRSSQLEASESKI